MSTVKSTDVKDNFKEYKVIQKEKTFSTKKERNSGIELLKIIAIVLIVISHVVYTLKTVNPYISYNGYVVDLSIATADIWKFILAIFSYFGALGNSIFFICSAWFLLRSSKYNKQKWFFMLCEIWFVSMFIFVVMLIIRKGDISGEIFLNSIMPTTFTSNWYLTCYLLFWPIHPLLNVVINKLDKQHLFRISTALFVIYACFNFIKKDSFFPSTIILWITIYFVMAYIQLYLKNFADSVKYNFVLLLVGFVGWFGIAFMANFLGLHISFLSDKVLRWQTNYNPFLIILAIALFNLMRKLTFTNKIVNYISSLSLLVYIIHENIVLRNYCRTALWNYVYENYGYSHILLWVFIIFFIVFIFALISSIIYDKTIRTFIRKLADTLYSIIRNVYLKVEKLLLKAS